MATETVLVFYKLLVAHLATDFFLQKKSWTVDRVQKHFRSFWLYVHCSIAGITTYLILGDWYNWQTPLLIIVTHTFIDLWKSYQKSNLTFFLLDQLLHITVLVIAWILLTGCQEEFRNSINTFLQNKNNWIYFIGYVLMTTPLGFTIGFATEKWRSQLSDNDGLAFAGKWIGICERIIILTLMIFDQFEAIGLLVAAKSILRFVELKQQDVQKKSEYVLIGTLISFGSTLLIGVVVKMLIGLDQ